MDEIHVLTSDGDPIAGATRWERLSMEMTRYSPAEQKLMNITSIPMLDDEEE